MRLIQMLLLVAVLANPPVSLAAADITPAGNGQGYLLAQVEVRRDDSRPVVKKEVENRVQTNRESSGGNASPGVPRPVKNTGLTSCPGEFALCAASTCKPTGRMIKVKEADGKTTKEYPEAVCKCPIITAEVAVMNGKPLEGLAALNEGNMNGSCNPPRPGTIWSLFSPLEVFPQESSNPPFQLAHTSVMSCPSSPSPGSNCFSFECVIDKEPAANGVRTASCSCPIGENPFGAPTENASFLTSAGNQFANQSSACSMYPVSIPNISDLK